MKKTTIKIRSYDQYILSLQEERCKIQVFRRELPLCLQLVDQAIENYKRRVCSSSKASHGTDEDEERGARYSNEGRVLEEFIPPKPQQDKSNNNSESKTDWLKSAQLWNQKSALVSDKVGTLSPQIKENGGTFLPFLKINSLQTTTLPAAEDTGMPVLRPPAHIPTTSTSSTAGNSRKTKQDKAKDNRKTRRCWSQELHRKFLHSLQQLGGCHAATPKQIRELMKVDGLTSDEVKSHLQKYRLHTRRPAGSPVHNTGNSQPTQYVVVGRVWRPPQNYAAATKGDATSKAPNKIYVPVAAPPKLRASQLQQQQQWKPLRLSVASPHLELESDRVEHSMRDHNAHSGSPATASSTETTTASPHF